MTLYAEWGGDFVLTNTGSLQAAVGWDEIRQRIERRLLTSPSGYLPDGTPTAAEYIFHPDYGEDLQAYVGQNIQEGWINGVRKSVIAGTRVDVSVQPDTIPTVTFQQASEHSVYMNIIVQLITGEPGVISLELT